MLKSYEKLMAKHASIQKRVKAGDTSAMSELSDLAKEQAEFAKKLDAAKVELSQEQLQTYIKEYTRITNKYLSATQPK